MAQHIAQFSLGGVRAIAKHAEYDTQRPRTQTKLGSQSALPGATCTDITPRLRMHAGRFVSGARDVLDIGPG